MITKNHNHTADQPLHCINRYVGVPSTVHLCEHMALADHCHAMINHPKTENIIAKETNGPRCEKPCLREFANNKGSDQPEHPRSLISALVIRLLESTISKLATSEI